MKKIFYSLICIIFAILALSITIIATDAPGADAEQSEADENAEIKTYVEEKIIPIIIGVLTSVIALLGTLKSIFKSLKELKASKEGLVSAQGEIRDNSRKELEAIRKKYEEMKSLIEDVPKLQEEIQELRAHSKELIKQTNTLCQMSKVAFCANPELVRAGKAREIAKLAENLHTDAEGDAENEGEM